MDLKQKKNSETAPAPEKLRYSRYYEHDGALRVYANRTLVLALLCVPSTLLALAFAVYVRVQPPTVIRVNQNGEAMTMGQTAPASGVNFSIAQGADTEANEFERKAFVHTFLSRYEAFSPDTVNRNWADALNLMTSNLRRVTFSSIEKNNLVGQIQDDQTRSEFRLKSLDVAKDDPLTFTVFGVREVHHIHDHQEKVDQLVEEYHIRLTQEKRSEENPSGLLVAEYWEQAIQGERRDSILNQDTSGDSQ
jgi:hypothetical protein